MNRIRPSLGFPEDGLVLYYRSMKKLPGDESATFYVTKPGMLQNKTKRSSINAACQFLPTPAN